MAKGIRYFNFPIQLLENFLVDSASSLNRISDYCLFAYTLGIDEECGGDEILFKMEAATKYYRMSVSNLKSAYKQGEKLYNSIPKKSPHCGMRLEIFWDFYKSHKTDFEKACLLAFLSYRSIIGPKPYCRVTNSFLIARMDGKIHVSGTISNEVARFATEYQLRKIKRQLQMDWHLVCYGRGTRGCFATFDMSREDLIYEVETKKAEYRMKEIKREERAMLERVKERIRSEQKSQPI